jgi:hypothetical protein
MGIFVHYLQILWQHQLAIGYITIVHFCIGVRGGAVVEALRYKPAGRGIDSRWCH